MLDAYENSLFKKTTLFATHKEKNHLFKEYIDNHLIFKDDISKKKVKNHLENNLYGGSKIYFFIEDEKESDILDLALKGESVNIIYPLLLQKKYIDILKNKNSNALDFNED